MPQVVKTSTIFAKGYILSEWEYKYNYICEELHLRLIRIEIKFRSGMELAQITPEKNFTISGTNSDVCENLHHKYMVVHIQRRLHQVTYFPNRSMNNNDMYYSLHIMLRSNKK